MRVLGSGLVVVLVLVSSSSTRAEESKRPPPPPAVSPTPAPATALAPASAGREKIGALILKSAGVDEELADNLTEVLISRLAGKGEREIAGKEELRSRLGIDDKAAAGCMENLGCLGRVGTELGVTRMVVGTLGKRGADYLYSLSLIDIGSGRVENRVFELIAGGQTDTLIAAVQATADRLLLPKVELGALRVDSETKGALVYLDESFIGSSPVRRDGVEPGPHKLRIEKDGHRGWTKEIEVPAGSTLQIKVPLKSLPARRRWPAPLVAVFALVAVFDAVVGLVLAGLSLDVPAEMTVSRRVAIDSSQKRFLYRQSGVFMLGLGVAFAIAGTGVAIGYRKDIFPSAPSATIAIAPTSDGAMARLSVTW